MTFPSRLVAGAKMPYQQANEIIGNTALTVAGTTGTSSLTSAQLSASLNLITSNATNGQVTLPACETGAMCVVVNRGANAVTVYGRGTNTVNNLVSMSLTISGIAIFFGTGTDWLYITASINQA